MRPGGPCLDELPARAQLAVTAMRMISLRRLLSKLAVLALSATPAAAGEPPSPTRQSLPDPDLEDDLPIDREHIDPRDAAEVLGRSLAQALSELRPLDAIHLATTWSLSHDSIRRAAIAHALNWAFPLLGDSAIIEHLSRDPNPVIRAASARAAWVRRATGVDQAVLDRLADDPDPEVRAIAARAR